jgi:tetratricopeptide (TPR) repeat protein
MTDTSKTPQETDPKAPQHDELAEVKQFIDAYGKPIVTGILVVLIAVAAIQLFTSRRQSRNAEAARQLGAATTIPDFESIVENYGSTSSAPSALLAAAKLYYDNANYEIALAKYDAFIRDNPEAPMLTTAELGRIFCIEARNAEASLQEAANAYAAFAKANPDSFLVSQAIFGQARCFEQLGELENARAVYEDFIAKHAESPWILRAENLLEQVTRRIDNPKATTAAPVMPPVAPSVLEVPTIAIPAPIEIPAPAEAAPVVAEPVAEPIATDAN